LKVMLLDETRVRTNSDVALLFLTQIKWTNADWTVPRTVTVKTNENFIDDGVKTYVITTKPVISNSEYYNNFDVADLTLSTKSRKAGSCSGTGDPHYTVCMLHIWITCV
jgi:hypothetical protein